VHETERIARVSEQAACAEPTGSERSRLGPASGRGSAARLIASARGRMANSVYCGLMAMRSERRHS
jgi:hypothetical protein